MLCLLVFLGMSPNNDLDGFKKVLDVPSIRHLSNEKVMELVKLRNSRQTSENSLAAILAAAPKGARSSL